MSQNESENYIQATVFGNTHVRVQRVNSDVGWDKPVYAINWFDARHLQLYNFYNLLANRSVNKVGGKALFKGRLVSRLIGSDEDERQLLLLVRYPSPQHFKHMLGNTYFKGVSVLRSLAVKRFTFCLSHLVGEEGIPAKRAENGCFGVHHFRGDMRTMQLIQASLQQSSMGIAFSSMKSHRLLTVSGNNPPESIPAVMEGIVLFRCKDENELAAVVESELHQKSLQNSRSSYVGLYRRIL